MNQQVIHMAIKIGFIGAPGSGKTTISQNFVSLLRIESKKRVELIDEFARSFVSTFQNTSIKDQYLIAHKQIDKENEFESSDYLITDSPVILSLFYSYLCIDWNECVERYYLNEIYKLLIDRIHMYDFLFYLNPLDDINLDDGKRIHTNEQENLKINQQISYFINLHKINYVCLKGTFEEKIKQSLSLVLC